MTLGDGSIDPIRRGIPIGATSTTVLRFRDAVHLTDGLHYQRLAQDLNLFVNGKWKDKDCAEWQELGRIWEGFHPLCAWGGRWGDLNHVSVMNGGKK